MATHLDLEEQEQLDQLKAFWKKYGNLITWVLIVVLGGYAAWNGWNLWQRDQAVKAGAIFDELEQAAQSGDAARTLGIFGDLKDRYPGTVYAEQGGLLTAKTQYDGGERDQARGTLEWVAEQAGQPEYQAIERLRLAGILLDEKKYDEALKQLDAIGAKEFFALAADRRGDVLLAQGKKDEARAAYQSAWKTMDPSVEYRRLIDAKLTALGAAPEPIGTAAAASVK